MKHITFGIWFSSLTNIAYIWYGAGELDSRLFYGISLILLGLASFSFHITPMNKRFRKFQRADIATMYFALNIAIGYHMLVFDIPEYVIITSVAVISLWMIYYERYTSSTFLIPSQYLILSLIVISQGHDLTFMWWFVIGLIFNIPHLTGHLKSLSPWSHGIWHICTAVGLGLL